MDGIPRGTQVISQCHIEIEEAQKFHPVTVLLHSSGPSASCGNVVRFLKNLVKI